MVAFFEFLERISGESFSGELIFIDIVYFDFVFIVKDVCHYEVLLNSGGEHRISAIIDMFANDVYPAGGSAKEGGLASV